MAVLVAKENPLQQGLKHISAGFGNGCGLRRKGKSTTTRIETDFFAFIKAEGFFVAKENPLQQGLKQNNNH